VDVLLDTAAVLILANQPERVSPSLRELNADLSTEFFISTIRRPNDLVGQKRKGPIEISR
jgi:PIN domain nuclease of toxin-antitoxin system